MRIVSLLPGATEIVVALGAADALVGISHECDYPASITHVPRVTASVVSSQAGSAEIDASVSALARDGLPVFTIDADVVRELAPTLIITQALCDVCAVSDGVVYALRDVLSEQPRIVTMSGRTLDGVWQDIRDIGEAIGRSGEAHALIESIAARLQRVHGTLKAARAPRPRVAVIEWLDPLFAAGHWTPELIRRGGGIDILAEPGAHSVRITVEAIRSAAPDLLLFAPCGFDVSRAHREATALLETPGWEWARGIEAWAIDGNALTSRAGPRLAEAVEVMASIFAPSLFDATSRSLARRC